MLAFTCPSFTIYPDCNEFYLGVRREFERLHSGKQVITNYDFRICIIPCLVFHVGFTTTRLTA